MLARNSVHRLILKIDLLIPVILAQPDVLSVILTLTLVRAALYRDLNIIWMLLIKNAQLLVHQEHIYPQTSFVNLVLQDVWFVLISVLVQVVKLDSLRMVPLALTTVQ
jgi:hypothetical protein